MCKNERSAFWSIDAAFALVLAAAMSAMFSAVLFYAGTAALRLADEESGSLLSARFSSYALSRLENGEDVDLGLVLGRTGRSFASISLSDDDGGFLFASEGKAGGEIYCTRRLSFMDGRMARLEACIS
jgi:hypothetical protein